MRRSLRHCPIVMTAMIAATLAGTPQAWAAPHKSPGVTTYAWWNPPSACRPDWTTCTASGSADASTGAMEVAAGIGRTLPADILDERGVSAEVGEAFMLTKPARQITAAVSMTGIALQEAGAHSLDGGAVSEEVVGASMSDSGCSSPGCGTPSSAQGVTVRLLRQLAGANTADSSDPTSSRTFTLTLSMPDGSDLPAGEIDVSGFVSVGLELQPLTCAVQQSCTPLSSGSPHTGDAHAGISATVSNISVTVQ